MLIIIYSVIDVKPSRFYKYCITISTLMVNVFLVLFLLKKNDKAGNIFISCQITSVELPMVCTRRR